MISFKICNNAQEMFGENDLEEIIREYQQCANNTLQGNLANFDMCDQQRYYHIYEDLEKKEQSFVYVIMADEEKNVGVVILELDYQAHYGYKVAFINSLFLLSKYRRLNYGKKLIEFAMKLAKKKGAKGMYFTAPAGSRLESVYNRLYIKTDSLFFKEL